MIRMLFCAVAFILPLLSSSLAHSSTRFRACNQYDVEINSAVKAFYPRDFQYPVAWKAQLYQESLCDAKAVSPVGARGLAQFMPGTWADMIKKFGGTASPPDLEAIYYGAYYMSRLMKGWTSKRSTYEKWQLALGSYNAGFGNLLKAQKTCNKIGRRSHLWSDIEYCLHFVTGSHSQETKTYVIRIKRWMRKMARTRWDLPREMRR